MEDLANHGQLKGAIFKRKVMDPDRLKGLGCFGAALGLWAYFPHVALVLGNNLTTLGMVGLSLGGMFKF